MITLFPKIKKKEKEEREKGKISMTNLISFFILFILIFPREIGIANVQRSFNWSSRLLKCMGVWPLKNYVPLFLFFFIYLSIHCSLTLLQLILTPKTMENVVSNMAENMLLTMTLTKITVARVNREALGKLFAEIKDCSLTEKYETKEEKLTFFNYTKLPPYFIIIIASSMTMVEILYYSSRLTYGIQSGNL
ncbi:odorant receptor 4-like [Vespula maculifrons]|uniref:Odorant receptor 4-like n=1 Tax=Vespula maculifrons TaxID=7453 RepID=A0ABD2BPN2_VESMC